MIAFSNSFVISCINYPNKRIDIKNALVRFIQNVIISIY